MQDQSFLSVGPQELFMQGLTEEHLIVKWASCLNITIIVRIEDSFLSISIIRLSETRSCLARA